MCQLLLAQYLYNTNKMCLTFNNTWCCTKMTADRISEKGLLNAEKRLLHYGYLLISIYYITQYTCTLYFFHPLLFQDSLGKNVYFQAALIHFWPIRDRIPPRQCSPTTCQKTITTSTSCRHTAASTQNCELNEAKMVIRVARETILFTKINPFNPFTQHVVL